MATLNILQDRFETLIELVCDNADVKKYFKEIDTHSTTKGIDLPYLGFGFVRDSIIELKGITTTGPNNKITNNGILSLGVTIIISHDDAKLVAQELMQAIEVFANAFEGGDITFGGKFLGDLNIIFNDFESLSNEPAFIKKAEGKLNISIQPYSGGTL